MVEQQRSRGEAPHPFDDADARDLLQQAAEARAAAYAPYSAHPVGAALLATDGRIFRGVNVENASYGLSLCAERAAVASAITAGAREFIAIAIAGPHDDVPCPPCGACRQVLHEAAPGMLVVTSDSPERAKVTPLPELLPAAFDIRDGGHTR